MDIGSVEEPEEGLVPGREVELSGAEGVVPVVEVDSSGVPKVVDGVPGAVEGSFEPVLV